MGHVSTITAGEFIQATGQWSQDRQHGLQFKAQFLTATAPTTAEGIEKYLGSGLIKGIGPVYAKKLVHAFGTDVFDVIEQDPGKLRQVAGIGPFRADKIMKGWADQKVIRDIMLFLHSHSISTARAVRIYKTYGPEAIKVISENPYRLARDIRGIGFVSADQIAEKMGIEKTSLIRAQAGIAYALTKAMDDGHCGLPTTQLLSRCQELLQVPDALIQEALSLELSSREVVQETIDQKECIFLRGLAHAETSIAERLLIIKDKPLAALYEGNWKRRQSKALSWLIMFLFTSKDIEKALLRAHGRGVTIDVIVDRGQKTAKGSIIHSLAQAGIRVSFDSIKWIAHNKVMILDQETVITGSFNFSNAANTRNAENLLIIKDKPLAALYEGNWKRRQSKALPYKQHILYE